MKLYASALALYAFGSVANAFVAKPPVSSSTIPTQTSLSAISGIDGRDAVPSSNSLNGVDYGSVAENDYYVDGDYGGRRRSGTSYDRGYDRGYGRGGYGGSDRGYGRGSYGYGDGYRRRDRYGSRGRYGRRGYGGDGYRTRTNSRSGLETSNIFDASVRDSTNSNNSYGYGERRRFRGSGGYGSRYRSGYRGSYAPTRELFEDIDQISVQGGSLRTCSFHEDVERAVIFLKTEGRPLNAEVNLWQGPDNAPQKMTVYLEDGNKRPFRAIVETPGSSNAVAIRNTGELEYPLTAGIELDMSADTDVPFRRDDYKIVQGGAVYTTPFAPAVQSVRVCLRTDGRPLNARVELLQGPNNDKQVVEVYSEEGMERPFHMILDTPGVGNVVRIVNTATVEFPLTAALEPYIIDENAIDDTFSSVMTWS